MFEGEKYLDLMPRFYFHRFDEVTSLDNQGTELPDAEAAVALARKTAAASIAERTKESRKVAPSHHIDVEDDDGAPVATVRFADVVVAPE